jgi:hypothetical protein
MVTRILLSFNNGPFELPPADDLAVYPGAKTVNVAVTVKDPDGFPVIVFVPIRRDLLPNLIERLTEAV